MSSRRSEQSATRARRISVTPMPTGAAKAVSLRCAKSAQNAHHATCWLSDRANLVIMTAARQSNVIVVGLTALKFRSVFHTVKVATMLFVLVAYQKTEARYFEILFL